MTRTPNKNPKENVAIVVRLAAIFYSGSMRQLSMLLPVSHLSFCPPKRPWVKGAVLTDNVVIVFIHCKFISESER